MRAALIPMKSLAQAKMRLADVLDRHERSFVETHFRGSGLRLGLGGIGELAGGIVAQRQLFRFECGHVVSFVLLLCTTN